LGIAHDTNGSEFETLFREYESSIFGLIYGLVGDRETAADLTQEVFLKASAAFDRHRPVEPLRDWLAGIAKDHILDYFRKRKIAVAAVDDGLDIPELAFAGETDLQEMIRTALRRLAPEQRDLLIMRYFLDLTYEDIADARGIPVAAAKVRTFRAKSRLREILMQPN
jgi:RNA polymerase sigma-70 factor (ECF subfamily)